VKTLKQQARASQAELLAVLEEMESNGMVEDIRPLWIVNTVSCHATKAAINELAQRRDISTLYYIETTKWIDQKNTAVSVKSARGVAENVLIVNADKVWELGYTGEGVLIGQLDTGVNYEHNDLQGRLWDGGEEFPNHGYDVFYHDNDPSDYVGHGTFVAGTMVGTGASGTQTGVAPGATVMQVKVFPDSDDGTDEYNVVEGMEFAIEHGAQLLNMSLGKPGEQALKAVFRQGCDNVLAAGVVAVVSAGNERIWLELIPVPYNLGCPSSCPPPYLHPDQMVNPGGQSCVISVGAVNNNDEETSFSSVGPVVWNDIPEYGDYPYTPGNDTLIGLIKPDVCAPGVGVVSLDFSNVSGYKSDLGTSFAAPCVTGTIALMLSKNPDLTPAEVDEILETTAVKLSERKSNVFGSGRIDALAAILAVGDDGMDEITEESFAVYPNPANEIIIVDLTDLETQNTASLHHEYRIIDMMGQTILSGVVSSEKQKIEVSNLQNGMYFITIEEMTKKFVVKR